MAVALRWVWDAVAAYCHGGQQLLHLVRACGIQLVKTLNLSRTASKEGVAQGLEATECQMGSLVWQLAFAWYKAKTCDQTLCGARPHAGHNPRLTTPQRRSQTVARLACTCSCNLHHRPLQFRVTHSKAIVCYMQLLQALEEGQVVHRQPTQPVVRTAPEVTDSVSDCTGDWLGDTDSDKKNANTAAGLAALKPAHALSM